MKSFLRAVHFFALACLVGPMAYANEIYFPPKEAEWATAEPKTVHWDEAGIDKALDFAGTQRSTGVVILHRGRILAERYWKLTDDGSREFNQRLRWNAAGQPIEDVASVQKSVVSMLVGIAREKGLLTLDDPVSQYLGNGWTRATPAQERAITIRHLLTMTSGLNEKLDYSGPPGTQWLYNTAAYAKTMDVLEAATKMNRQRLTREWLTDPIGMSDTEWVSRGPGVRSANAFGFATTARDLARFGLLVSAGGRWEATVVLGDREYLAAATRSSQRLKPTYGYLWWVSRDAFSPEAAPMPPTAPADMFCAKGALGRRCCVVPSLDLVVTRLGNSPVDERTFDSRFWELVMAAAPKK